MLIQACSHAAMSRPDAEEATSRRCRSRASPLGRQLEHLPALLARVRAPRTNDGHRAWRTCTRFPSMEYASRWSGEVQLRSPVVSLAPDRYGRDAAGTITRDPVCGSRVALLGNRVAWLHRRRTRSRDRVRLLGFRVAPPPEKVLAPRQLPTPTRPVERNGNHCILRKQRRHAQDCLRALRCCRRRTTRFARRNRRLRPARQREHGAP